MAIGTLAAIGLGTTAATTVGSFVQASKQRRAQKKAEEAAAASVKEARERLPLNVYETLAVPQEPYRQAREQALVTATAGLQAAQEAGRPEAAAGRIQMASQQAQQDIRAAQEERMFQLDKLIAAEEGRLLDMGYDLSLQEAQGAQTAAAQAATARQMALGQGLQGLASFGAQAAAAPGLYSSRGAGKVGELAGVMGDENLRVQAQQMFPTLNLEGLTGQALQDELVGSLTPRQLRQLYGSGMEMVSQVQPILPQLMGPAADYAFGAFGFPSIQTQLGSGASATPAPPTPAAPSINTGGQALGIDYF